MVKIGRNAPCPCGSGKKYKKCCLDKHRAADSMAASAKQEIMTTLASRTEPSLTMDDVRKTTDTLMNWENEQYKQLAYFLADNMKESYDAPLILETVALWNRYSGLMKPVIRKPGSYCAGLEYFASQAHGVEVTQAELADKYSVSTATLSKRFQELMAFAEETYAREAAASAE